MLWFSTVKTFVVSGDECVRPPDERYTYGSNGSPHATVYVQMPVERRGESAQLNHYRVKNDCLFGNLRCRSVEPTAEVFGVTENGRNLLGIYLLLIQSFI